MNDAGNVVFAPSDGTWLLTGRITPAGVIVATATHPGADKRPFVTRLDAAMAAGRVKGTYKTPRCVFDVDLAPRTRA